MTLIEATGGSLSCHRCGLPAPPVEADRAGWGSLFLNGRLVALACPDCLTDEERDEIDGRRGAGLWEVASARRACTQQLRELAAGAVALGGPPLGEELLDALDPDGSHVGVVAVERDGAVVAMWAVEAADGRTLGAFSPVALERWMALEEVYVPYRVQTYARDLARTRLG